MFGLPDGVTARPPDPGGVLREIDGSGTARPVTLTIIRGLGEALTEAES